METKDYKIISIKENTNKNINETTKIINKNYQYEYIGDKKTLIDNYLIQEKKLDIKNDYKQNYYEYNVKNLVNNELKKYIFDYRIYKLNFNNKIYLMSMREIYMEENRKTVLEIYNIRNNMKVLLIIVDNNLEIHTLTNNRIIIGSRTNDFKYKIRVYDDNFNLIYKKIVQDTSKKFYYYNMIFLYFENNKNNKVLDFEKIREYEFNGKIPVDTNQLILKFFENNKIYEILLQ